MGPKRKATSIQYHTISITQLKNKYKEEKSAHSAEMFFNQGSRIKDQGSRIRWSFENALDLKKKPLQRLLWAKIKWRQSIKKSAREKLHETRNTSRYSSWVPSALSGKRVIDSKIKIHLTHMSALESRNPTSLMLLRVDSHFAYNTR